MASILNEQFDVQPTIESVGCHINCVIFSEAATFDWNYPAWGKAGSWIQGWFTDGPKRRGTVQQQLADRVYDFEKELVENIKPLPLNNDAIISKVTEMFGQDNVEVGKIIKVNCGWNIIFFRKGTQDFVCYVQYSSRWLD